MAQKKKSKTRGVNVSVSPQAHEKMVKAALAAKPDRLSLRELVNITMGLSKEL